MSWRSPLRLGLVVAGVTGVLGVVGVVGVANPAGADAAEVARAETTPGSDTTTTSAPPVVDPLGWVVIDAESACPTELEAPEGSAPIQITRAEQICLSRPVENADAPLVFEPGATSVSVDPEFRWTGEQATTGLPATFAVSGARREVVVTFDLAITIEWRVQDSGSTPSATSTTTTSEAQSTDDGSVSSDVASSDVTIGARGVTKVIRFTGADASTLASGGSGPRLTLVDELPSELLLARDPEGNDIDPDEGSIRIPITATTASYGLSLAPGSNFGNIVDRIQSTAVLLGDQVVATAEQRLSINAPDVDIDVQAGAVVDEGGTTTIGVTVSNRDAERLEGPITVTVRATTDSSLVADIRDVSDDGTVESGIITWTVEEGIDPGADDVTRTATVEFGAVTESTRISWRAAVRASNATEATPLTTDSVTILVDDGDQAASDVSVDFTPGQLIRLLAFVIAFATMATIFGAWMRHRYGTDTVDAAARQHELDVFSRFTEVIVVLVILVAILVLALRGSLAGESAASLIGVIAGYVLGTSRKN